MPTKNGRGLDEQGCFTPSRRDSRGKNNHEALPARPPDAPGNLPLGGDELLSKKRVLRNQLRAAANQIHRQPENEPKKVDHVSSLTSSTRGWNLQPGRVIRWHRQGSARSGAGSHDGDERVDRRSDQRWPN